MEPATTVSSRQQARVTDEYRYWGGVLWREISESTAALNTIKPTQSRDRLITADRHIFLSEMMPHNRQVKTTNRPKFQQKLNMRHFLG